VFDTCIFQNSADQTRGRHGLSDIYVEQHLG
jgi:hypothetical protein